MRILFPSLPISFSCFVCMSPKINGAKFLVLSCNSDTPNARLRLSLTSQSMVITGCSLLWLLDTVAVVVMVQSSVYTKANIYFYYQQENGQQEKPITQTNTLTNCSKHKKQQQHLVVALLAIRCNKNSKAKLNSVCLFVVASHNLSAKIYPWWWWWWWVNENYYHNRKLALI